MSVCWDLKYSPQTKFFNKDHMELPLCVKIKTWTGKSRFFPNYYVLFLECKHSGYLREAPRWPGLELLPHEWRSKARDGPFQGRACGKSVRMEPVSSQQCTLGEGETSCNGRFRLDIELKSCFPTLSSVSNYL